MAVNAHRLLSGGDSGNYLANLAIAQADEARLRAARDEIRGALRTGIQNWQGRVEKRILFDDRLSDIQLPALRPKFRMQGSFAYRTVNDPAQAKQEIDLDDGLFLPISFLVSQSGSDPVVASHGLFKLVEAVLAPVCRRNGWTLDTTKSSCVRVQISAESHIDVALYAVSDDEFRELVEKRVLAKALELRDDARRQFEDSVQFDEDVYGQLSGDRIRLAHREDGWKPSDPRKLEAWFQGAIATYGEQIRRLSRYFKGWRDHTWATCRLASIALMAAVVKTFQATPSSMRDNRDDLATLIVAEALPDILRGTIANPVVQGQRLDENWTADQRADYIAAARTLAGSLKTALEGSDAGAAVKAFVARFGHRIPTDASLVVAAGVGATATRLSAPATPRLDEVEQMRRAARAVEEARARGTPSKPWSR